MKYIYLAVTLLLARPVYAQFTTINGALISSDPVLAGNRVSRDGAISTCTNPKAYPGTFPTSKVHYRTFMLSAPATSTCATITYLPQCSEGSGANTFLAVYNGSFDPTNVATNYVGDIGGGYPDGTTATISVTIPAGAQYVLVVNGAVATTTCSAYTINVAPPSPLPVQLTTFTAEAVGSAARLSWLTVSELNNARFEVEASADGRTFARLGSVAGHGTTQLAHQYRYTDENLARYAVGLLYYRLRQVDQDGKDAYSPVRTVAVAGASLTLYPNPSSHIATLSGATANVPVQVYSTLGNLVLTTQTNAAGTATLALPSGLYLVRAGAAPALRLTVE